MMSEKEIIMYLKQKVEEGQIYFKSKFVAREIGERPKRIGQLLYKFSQKEEISGIKVIPWSRAFSITWRISKA